MVGWKDVICLDGWMDEWLDGGVGDGWMDGGMDGWNGLCLDGRMA